MNERMSLSIPLPPLTSDLPRPSLCTATVTGISEAGSLIYFPVAAGADPCSPRAVAAGDVCDGQHTLGITSTPFRPFCPSSCCCISLHLHLWGSVR